MLAAMVLNKDEATDAVFVKHVETYLQRTAEAAMQMLPKTGSAIGDCFAGEDDSIDDLD